MGLGQLCRAGLCSRASGKTTGWESPRHDCRSRRFWPALAGGILGLEVVNRTLTYQPLDILTMLGFVILIAMDLRAWIGRVGRGV